ncbi:MAG TPA: HDOD domain-containing protein [Caldimonas sp.]|jgi:HD-like signal output (HDOD) protein|nr:HDOD domain-containing protein [Caldimonas sp.]HEX4234622.1 HDOD domain-containing protein [Caldimonas sp.]
MTSSAPKFEGLVRPLRDLAGWASHFRRAEIPVLRETIDALDALRANEERTDANSIGEMIGGDPLMTLKVLVHVGEHRGRTVVTGAETVISALVMMGIPPFFRTFAAPEAIEDHLASSPAALAGVQRVLQRAHRGARFALAFAIHRADPHAASIHTAALLQEFAELLLWCHAPVLALRVRALQDADPALRSNAAQKSVLNVELGEIQQFLAVAWRLPALLADKAQEVPGSSTGARTVALASRLARHVAHGWDNAAVPDDVAEIGQFLNLSVGATLDLLTGVDVR